MWIVVRLLAVIVAFIARYLLRLFPPTPAGNIGNTHYYQKLRTTKQGNITQFRIGVPLRIPVIFRLQEEQGSDRFFKELGLAMEFQTGDVKFDKLVYIACDHPSLFYLLQENEAARDAIENVLGEGFKRISCDGDILWIEKNIDRKPTERELSKLVSLRDVFANLKQRHQHYVDPFLFKVVAVEAFTWSIFGYSAGSLLEYMFHKEDYHLDKVQLCGYGFLAALLLFGCIFAMIVLLLRGSSRGHRIIIEGALVLVLSLPVAGIQLVSDLNRELDYSESVLVTRDVVKTERHKHRSRKGGTWYSYHLFLERQYETSAVQVPTEIEISKEVYLKASNGVHHQVELHIGNGGLGLPWYRRIEII